MKTFRLMIVGAILVGIFAVAGIAQTGTQQIAVINTLAFGGDDKGAGGITKYMNAQKKLDSEFTVENQQLTNLGNQINALKKEIQGLQDSAAKGVPVKQDVVTDKASKHDDLVRQYKFSEESAKAKYSKRLNEVLGPVNQDIGNAIQAFAKQKGYAMILDAARLDNAGLILAFDTKFDVTDEFIKFYNARPAGTASTTN